MLRRGQQPRKWSGGNGADHIEVGSSLNRVRAGRGDDRIFAANERLERIRCGGGRDEVRADVRDRIAADCERVRRAR